MTHQFSDRVRSALEASHRRSRPGVADDIQRSLGSEAPMFAAKCIEFELALGGYLIEGTYPWRLGIDPSTAFEDNDVWFAECAVTSMSTPFDVNINSHGQICADNIPMAETPWHFIEREAIANWCRRNWKGGQRLRTENVNIETLFETNLDLRKVDEACDQWETWWVNDDRKLAACRFHLWGSAAAGDIAYWFFDAHNSELSAFAVQLKRHNIDYSIDSWIR